MYEGITFEKRERKSSARLTFNRRKVIEYDIDGNIIKIYNSVNIAASKNGFDNAYIIKCCNGTTKISRNNSIFLYEGVIFEKRVRLLKGKKRCKVIRIDKNRNEKIYNSIAEAALSNNIMSAHISDVCEGERFHSGGYLWRYVYHPKLEEYNKEIQNNWGFLLDIIGQKLINVYGKDYDDVLDFISYGNKTSILVKYLK